MYWSKLPENGDVPGPRSSHAIAAVGDKVYLFGGELQARVPLPADLYCYSLSTGTWQLLPTTGTCPGPRVAATLGALGSKLYLYGGRTGVEMTEGAKDDLFMLDTATNEWRVAVPADPAAPRPPARSYHAMAVSSATGKLYVFGGCGSSGRLNDLWCFDTASSSWQQLSSGDAVVARGGSVLVASPDGGQLFLMGGFNGNELRDCHMFDTSVNSWLCPSCCGSSTSSSTKSSTEDVSASAAGTNAPLLMPIGRSVFGAAVHSTCSRQGSSSPSAASATGDAGCTHNGHVVAFGGEVAPSDKGHAGAGNFTSIVYCMTPPTAAASDMHTCNSGAVQQQDCWHTLETGGEGPGPRGWFAATAVANRDLLVHGGLGADNERRGDMFMLHMHG